MGFAIHARVRRVSLTVSLLVLLASCYHLPIWSGSVKVTPLARAAVTTCGTGKLTPEGIKRITRSPYLQDTTTTSTVVAWGSTDGKGTVVVREPGGAIIKNANAVYAADPERQQERLAAQATTAGKPLAADDIYVVKAEIAGLEAMHLYCYQLVADGVALTEPAPLATAATPGRPDDAPIHFVALGDTGTAGAAEKAVAQQMSAVPFEFMLFLGDIAYESGTATQLQNAFFAIYPDFLRYVPAYPTLGNHERRTHQGRPYLEAFVLPEPERYYSFDWGDVHFVCIDTTHRDSKQLVWLDEDLKKTKQRWKIVFGHHPMYTNSLRGPEMWIRRAFAKIVTMNRVDLVLTGHEHQYERFKVANVNYVISGGGGGQLTHFWGSSHALKQKEVHHFLAFEVSANHLTMKAIDINGKEIETLHLDKSSGTVKTKVDGQPENKQTPLPPEKVIQPDEKLHDEPDDDKEHPNKAPGDAPATTTTAAPTQPGTSPSGSAVPAGAAPSTTSATAPSPTAPVAKPAPEAPPT